MASSGLRVARNLTNEGGVQGGCDGPTAWHASAGSRSPRWDNQIPCLVPHTGKGSPVVRGLVSTRRGSEESGTNAPFWPGACATGLQHAAPFGSWLQGPGVNLQRATAMKPWKTSFATNETRDARPSFRLDPQWSGYGPVLPQGTSRKPGTGSDPPKPPLTICNRAISFMLVSKPLHSISQAREPVSLWLSCPRWLGSDSRGSHRPRSPHLSEQGTDNSERFSP